MNTLNRLEKQLIKAKEKDLFRRLTHHRSLVDFCSNDYLGLSKNPDLIQFISNVSIRRLGSGGSRLLFGNNPEVEKLQKFLANIHKTGSALLFNSGYSANLAFFSTIPDKNSLVIYDEKIHACVKDGMRLSLAKKVSFSHNSLESLEKRLIQSPKEKFVAIESIYSMDGDEAPIEGIIKLCKKYEASLIIDEAHSSGNYGKGGGGLIVEKGLEEEVFARIHTFGKGIGAHGACIVGDEILKEYLINKARPFIYSTALPPHDINILHAIYTYLEKHASRLQKKLNSNIKLFKSQLNKIEIESNSAIQVIIIPGNKEVKQSAQILREKGFDIRPVLSPTVPEGKERIRICLHAFNTEEEIQSLTESINELIP